MNIDKCKTCKDNESYCEIDKFDIHKNICDFCHTTYVKKNSDYGDSFSNVRNKYPNAILIRLNDKLSRLETLMGGKVQQVSDESIRDTLLDMANYCLIELCEMDYDSLISQKTEEKDGKEHK